MTAPGDLASLIRAIGHGGRHTAEKLLDDRPALAVARIQRHQEFFLAECLAQVYAGDTALHAAAFAYDVRIARVLVAHGADVHTTNRRGAQPLHAAVIGVPGSDNWSPGRQREVIEYLVGAGADPNAVSLGGVTPLHRAVRNRCSAAVEALLRSGADPDRANDRGSTALDLARSTTGRGGSGSTGAKAEQQVILELLEGGAGVKTG